MSEQKSTCQPRKAYKSDLTDTQWELIKDLLPAAVPKCGFAPTDLREVMNTLLYQNRTGCQWEMLPHDLLAKSTVFDYYQTWQEQGLWELLVDTLRGQIRVSTPRRPAPVEATAKDQPPAQSPPQDQDQAHQEATVLSNREETPSFVILDSQSAKTTEVGGEQRGYDGGKKVKGRKRHIAVDSLGLLVVVVVTAANVHDGQGACRLLQQLRPDKFPRLLGVCGDNTYHHKGFMARLQQRQLTLEIKTRPPGAKGFVLLKKRWVVERTFAWLGFQRRLSKDYERKVASSETRVRLAAISMMMRRLTKAS